MNKIVITLMCAMMSLTMMAQPGQGRWQMDRKRNADMVVNMHVIKHIGLDSAKVNAVRGLKERKAQAMKDMREESRQQQPGAGKQEMSREERQAKRQAAMQQWQQFVKEYRSELRSILGDEKYIEYLETLTASQQWQRNMPPRGPQMQGKHRQMRAPKGGKTVGKPGKDGKKPGKEGRKPGGKRERKDKQD